MNTAGTTHFDVFNGDADGLCALHQLRLAEPKPAELVTGAKRDNALLARVPARSGDSVTVLDLPLAANRAALLDLLERGVSVDYFDHHVAADPPRHPLLRLNLDPSPAVCTSVIVNRRIEGRFRAWAIVGAFGDNMAATAEAMAASLGLNPGTTMLLKALGESLNYNAYGAAEDELTIPPADLYRRLAPYADPLSFLEQEDVYVTLAQRCAEDMRLAMEVTPMLESERLVVTRLPDAAWARRVIGSYANQLAAKQPGRACAVLVPNADWTLTVSLRVPADAPLPASELASRFGGSGRATAAGIDRLPLEAVPHLVQNLRLALGGAGG